MPNRFLQADPPRQAARGLHFILGPARLAAAVRLSQTLGRMKSFALYLLAPVIVALLAPLAINLQAAPYPAIFLVGTIPVVFFFTLVVALPLYFSLPKRLRGQLIPLLCMAFVAGLLSFFVFSYATKGVQAQVGPTVLVQNGNYTASGWYEVLLQSFAMGIFSLPGGLLFWLGARQAAKSENAA